jgi:hypothetical protein
MTWKCVVTFEFNNDPPRMWRGEIEAGTSQTASFRAIKAAKKANPRVKAQSCLVMVEKSTPV